MQTEHKETSFEAALMPEVTFLQILWWALFGLFFPFPIASLLLKPVHLRHWLGISKCGHFPQCIVRLGEGWVGESIVYSVLSDLLFFLLLNLSYLFVCCWFNSGLDALRYKKENKPLIVSHAPVEAASLQSLSLHKHTPIWTQAPLFCNILCL